jgi:dihydrofolate reductase
MNIIVAMDHERGISKSGKIPWSLKPDMKRFKQLTSKTLDDSKMNAVIMGRGTYVDCGGLSNRLNIIVSRTIETSHATFPSFAEALEYARSHPLVESIWVIGGQGIYSEAVQHPLLEKIFLTKVYGYYGCDTFFPHVLQSNVVTNGPIEMYNDIRYSFHEIEIV